MADFPARRLLDADATMDEVAKLREEWETSDISVQERWDADFRTMSTGGIRTWLRAWRVLNSPEEPETLLGTDYGQADSDTSGGPEKPSRGRGASDSVPSSASKANADDPDE